MRFLRGKHAIVIVAVGIYPLLKKKNFFTLQPSLKKDHQLADKNTSNHQNLIIFATVGLIILIIGKL